MNINVSSLTVTYGKHTVLKDFSYEFSEGKVYVILGPNGCGKSTLVKSLVERHASGNIAYVAQETNGIINLTVQEYIELGRYNPGKFFGGLSASDKELVKDAIETMHLTGLENRLFDTLSGGEKQRVMAARALAQDAEWTVLDEPSANLDVKHTALILDTVRFLCDNKRKSFIIVLHDINDAVKYADKLLLMKDGELIKVTDSPSAEDFEMLYDTSFAVAESQSGRQLFFPA